MNRLQKKCYIAAIGLHLLLVVILFVGPAFLSHSNTDDTPVINFIPANLIDGNFSGGGPKNPTPAATATLTPPTPPVAQVTPQPPQPKPADVPKPTPAPVAKDEPKLVQKTKPDPETLDVKPAKEKPTISTKLITRKSTPTKTTTQDDDTAAARQRALAIAKSIRSLREGLSSSTTTIEAPQGFGGGGEAYANYATVVKSIYDSAWIEPADATTDDATGKVTVTVGSDGTVISARITTPSGDDKTDASIQRTLDRVKYIAPFPAGTTDKERTYIIDFNLKAKKLSA
jgi:colicin import membrane protein